MGKYATVFQLDIYAAKVMTELEIMGCTIRFISDPSVPGALRAFDCTSRLPFPREADFYEHCSALLGNRTHGTAWK